MVRSQDQCKFLQWFLSQTDANTTPGLFMLAWWAVKASGRFSQRFLSQVNSNMHQALHHGDDYATTNVYQFGRVRIQWAKKISFSDKFFPQFIFNDWLTYGIHMVGSTTSWCHWHRMALISGWDQFTGFKFRLLIGNRELEVIAVICTTVCVWGLKSLPPCHSQKGTNRWPVGYRSQRTI